jgi:uncharacterized membrane protein
MTFAKLISNVKKRVLKHWQTTVKGLLYGAFTVMFLKHELTVTEWIAAIGGILTFNSIFLQKDPDKTANKVKPQEVPVEEDESIR